MRKIILTVMLLLLVLLPAEAAELTAPEVPEAGAKLMPTEVKSFSQGLGDILKELLPLIRPDLSEAARISARLIAVCMLLSVLQTLDPQLQTVGKIAGTAVIGVLLFKSTHSMLRLGADTVNEMSEYAKLLLPALTAAMAAQGGVSAATALYAGSAVLITFLSRLIVSLLLPVQYLFLASAVAGSILGNDTLKGIKDLIKDMLHWCLKTILTVFTAYLGITGIVSGSTDAAVLKATKSAISGAIPVVGSILSDASEAVLVSAGLVRNTMGIYGILAVIAVFLGPFVRIGVQFVILRFTASVCTLLDSKGLSGLIGDFSEVLRMLLGMTGAMCILLLVSSVCFLKGVG